MSSTDLADEQTKHNIEVFEKEALEHSILQKVTAPRAKITHKGFEEIEVAGSRTTDAVRDEEEQRMATEKRERERLARVRATQHQGQEGSPTTPMGTSFGPNAVPASPATGTAPSWGAPPSVPIHASQNASEQNTTVPTRLPPRPLFVPSASDFSSVDQGLDLADLINIDEDMSPQDVPPSSNPQERMSEQLTASTNVGVASPVITSGPSPFAQAKPAESPMHTSFSLNNLWTEPEQTEPQKDTSEANIESSDARASPEEESREEGPGETIDLASDNDQDLDAMLDRAEQADKRPGPVDINSLPKVWEGQVRCC